MFIANSWFMIRLRYIYIAKFIIKSVCSDKINYKWFWFEKKVRWAKIGLSRIVISSSDCSSIQIIPGLYRKEDITPYMHIFAKHIPQFLRQLKEKGLSLQIFSTSSIEKKITIRYKENYIFFYLNLYYYIQKFNWFTLMRL